MFNLNTEIESILGELKVPYGFGVYRGDADTYITYTQTYKENPLYGDDEILGVIQVYDFDIYSKGNYLGVANDLIAAFTAAGWTYAPTRDSADMYEADTKFFHKTICLIKESEV